MKALSLALVLPFALTVACGTPSARQDKSAEAPLSGTIGGEPFQHAYGTAWRTEDGRVVVKLTGDKGPTGCFLENGDVWHEYADASNESAADDVTVWLPAELGTPGATWRSDAADAHIMDVRTPNGGGVSVAARAEVTITAVTAASISGRLAAANGAGTVKGSFVARFCKGFR